MLDKIGRLHIAGCGYVGGGAALSFIVTVPLAIVLGLLTYAQVIPQAWFEFGLFLVFLGVAAITSAVGTLFISIAWGMVMFGENPKAGCVVVAVLVMVFSTRLLLRIIRR